MNNEQSARLTDSEFELTDSQQQVKADEGLALLIGKSSKDIVSSYGEPSRIDPSLYGYDWWIYNQADETYMQVAMADDKVVSIYALGNDLNISPFYIGQPINDLYQTIGMETTIDIEWEDNSYRFELSEEDLGIRPLVKLGDVYAQVYMDKFEGVITSVRFLDAETLIQQRPYELIYRGELPEEVELTEEEWALVEQGNSQQIFDITNVIRKRFELDVVEWDDATAEVALLHSVDMYTQDYFSHDSPTHGDLGDRLAEGEVQFQLAGENIAAQYVDGVAAVEGWLNSKGHRDALLNEDFTHLGVGVYRKIYTQNFIKPF
ncbi:MAG: CAP domain-containing protein [Bacillus sp. (in: firmicutes)]